MVKLQKFPYQFSALSVFSKNSRKSVFEHPGKKMLVPPCSWHSGLESTGDVFCYAFISDIMSAEL